MCIRNGKARLRDSGKTLERMGGWVLKYSMTYGALVIVVCLRPV